MGGRGLSSRLDVSLREEAPWAANYPSSPALGGVPTPSRGAFVSGALMRLPACDRRARRLARGHCTTLHVTYKKNRSPYNHGVREYTQETLRGPKYRLYWLDYSPPTLANRDRFPAGSLTDFACANRAGRCCWSACFLGDIPIPTPLYSEAAPYSHRFTYIGFQDLDDKSRPNLSTGHGFRTAFRYFASRRRDFTGFDSTGMSTSSVATAKRDLRMRRLPQSHETHGQPGPTDEDLRNTSHETYALTRLDAATVSCSTQPNEMKPPECYMSTTGKESCMGPGKFVSSTTSRLDFTADVNRSLVACCHSGGRWLGVPFVACFSLAQGSPRGVQQRVDQLQKGHKPYKELSPEKDTRPITKGSKNVYHRTLESSIREKRMALPIGNIQQKAVWPMRHKWPFQEPRAANRHAQIKGHDTSLAIDICLIVHKTVESSLEVFELVNFSDPYFLLWGISRVKVEHLSDVSAHSAVSIVRAAVGKGCSRHARDVSEPIGDLQGNMWRTPYCQVWGNTGYSLEQQPMNTQLRLECAQDCGYFLLPDCRRSTVRACRYTSGAVAALSREYLAACLWNSDGGVRHMNNIPPLAKTESCDDSACPTSQPLVAELLLARGAALAERLDCSPPAVANRVQPSASPLPDLCKFRRCVDVHVFMCASVGEGEREQQREGSRERRRPAAVEMLIVVSVQRPRFASCRELVRARAYHNRYRRPWFVPVDERRERLIGRVRGTSTEGIKKKKNWSLTTLYTVRSRLLPANRQAGKLSFPPSVVHSANNRFAYAERKLRLNNGQVNHQPQVAGWQAGRLIYRRSLPLAVPPSRVVQLLPFQGRSGPTLAELPSPKSGEIGDTRENPPTSGIDRHDSHMRKCGRDPVGDCTRFTTVGGEPMLAASRLPGADWITAFQHVASGQVTPSCRRVRLEFVDKVDVKYVYTEVDFPIGSQIIRHALDAPEPIADWGGNKSTFMAREFVFPRLGVGLMEEWCELSDQATSPPSELLIDRYRLTRYRELLTPGTSRINVSSRDGMGRDIYLRKL
ncbi:hypothetical protein PR048_010033 [Dryococelus australis]|uniref:Uncharacterized protein n=1 Tax=Dryococelus australis TaxID=614101 RepID=A0ABQ9I1N4_9NEOP|nr:hypothetical protein PR048_010033 [Dryococelus australis]